MKIYAIHGFLGLPSDWSNILTDTHLNSVIEPIDILQEDPPPTMDLWARHFNSSLSKKGGPRILMGYSLGGRLALHALRDAPTHWDGAVIISANPGLMDPVARMKWNSDDSLWADRFAHEPWDQLIKAWNRRGVFSTGRHAFERKEEHYDRKHLTHILKHWNLGHQEDFRPWLSKTEHPILWMTGSDDKYYSQISETIDFKHPASRKVSISNAGHRTPWDNPVQFLSEITEYIKKLETL